MRTFLPAAALSAVSAAILLLLSGFVPQQSASAADKAKFDRESDPVRRAKLLPQLGTAEFQDMRTQISAGNYDAALKIYQLYRDQVVETEKTLDAKDPNPAKHSSGYRQLEISVREALRRSDDLAFEIPPEQKAPFSDVRNQLDQIDQRLIRELFPRDQTPGTAPAAPHS